MPHIPIPEGVPGILGPMGFRPETAQPMNVLAEVLLRGDHSLPPGDRELIAAYVSRLNDCYFCNTSHSAFAAAQLEGGEALVEQVMADPEAAPIGDKLRALLRVAAQVQAGGKCVTDEAVAAARELGATDLEIHDTVLIAAAFCMYNRYVDGLATWAPRDRETYRQIATQIVRDGYATAVPAAA